eukprot:Platyproteum_vivax@DN8291_c0_g1_i1.p1
MEPVEDESKQMPPTAPEKGPRIRGSHVMRLFHHQYPSETMDESCAELLADMANVFVQNATEGAAKMAKNRGNSYIEQKDFQMFLEMQYNLTVPTPDPGRHLAPAMAHKPHIPPPTFQQ